MTRHTRFTFIKRDRHPMNAYGDPDRPETFTLWLALSLSRSALGILTNDARLTSHLSWSRGHLWKHWKQENRTLHHWFGVAGRRLSGWPLDIKHSRHTAALNPPSLTRRHSWLTRNSSKNNTDQKKTSNINAPRLYISCCWNIRWSAWSCTLGLK